MTLVAWLDFSNQSCKVVAGVVVRDAETGVQKAAAKHCKPSTPSTVPTAQPGHLVVLADICRERSVEIVETIMNVSSRYGGVRPHVARHDLRCDQTPAGRLLRGDRELRGHRFDRHVLRVVLAPGLDHHPDHSLLQFARVPPGACHENHLSNERTLQSPRSGSYGGLPTSCRSSMSARNCIT